MPKQTFFNLASEKRNLIQEAAIAEFGSKSYTEASINVICKSANMAKGSFYQYFDDKLELYVYIMKTANAIKIDYFSHELSLLPQLNLIEQLKWLYIKGVEFSVQHPDLAALGDRISQERDEEAKKAVFEEAEAQADSFLIGLIAQAKSKGEIREDVSVEALSLLLGAMNQAVADHMSKTYGQQSYVEHKESLFRFVDDLMDLLSKGILVSDKEAGQ